MFTPVPVRLEDILNSPSQFAIPVYQREYKWGKEEASELLEDLLSYSDDEGSNLFLGNLIFEKTREKRIFVVDGQQRLTTILILLVACRMRAKQLGQTNLATVIQNKITFMDSTTAESTGCRLIASDSIRDVLELMAGSAWEGDFPTVIAKKQVKRKVKKVRPIYELFIKKLNELDKEALSKFLKAVYNSYVAKIEVEDEVEALSIFERTNARGLDLEISDLLKNFLFTKKIEGIEDLWSNIVENSGGTLLRMLKYFYVSNRGYVLKPQLYKKLKGYSAEVGPANFTEELERFSKFFSLCKSPDKERTRSFFEEIGFDEISSDQARYERINQALLGLKEFNVAQFCPPAYAAIRCISRCASKSRNTNAKKLIVLFEAYEKYHFINNAICERVGNEIEKLYADACTEYSESDDFAKTTDQLINDLRSKLASVDEFISNFKDVSYSTDQISLISYILDRFNNYKLDPGQSIPIYNPDPKLRRRNHNIEHFLAQKADDVTKLTKADQESIDNIGNLLALYFKDNSSLGNASPAEKVKRLKGDLSKKIQNLQNVQDFLEQYGDVATAWNADKIKQRALDMAQKGYREIWSF